jgi:hypothetical protein
MSVKTPYKPMRERHVGTSWNRVAGFTIRPLYPGGKGGQIAALLGRRPRGPMRAVESNPGHPDRRYTDSAIPSRERASFARHTPSVHFPSTFFPGTNTLKPRNDTRMAVP